MYRTVTAIIFAIALVFGVFSYDSAIAGCKPLSSFNNGGRDFRQISPGVFHVKSALTADADGAQNAYHLTLPRAKVGQPGPIDTICNGLKIKSLRSALEINGVKFPRGSVFNGYITKKQCAARDIAEEDCHPLSRAMCRSLVNVVKSIASKDWDQGGTHILDFFGIASLKHEKSTPTLTFRRPCIQGTGDPYPGYFVSQTAHHPSLARKHTGVCNPRRYVDANTIPYLVAPLDDQLAKQLGLTAAKDLIGTVIFAKNPRTGEETFGIFGDSGHKFGEGSVALGWHLNGTPNAERVSDYSAAVKKPVDLLLFPVAKPSNPGDQASINTAGAKAIKTAETSLEKLKACL